MERTNTLKNRDILEAASRLFLPLRRNKESSCRFKKDAPAVFEPTVTVHRTMNSCEFIKGCQAIQKRPA